MTEKQLKFHVRSKGRLIGSTLLESGDPPMGVASGRFFPADEYSEVYDVVVRTQGEGQQQLELEIWTAEGEPLSPCSHVYIEDYSAETELGDEFREVTICGLDWRFYEKLFPEHVEAYSKAFADK